MTQRSRDEITALNHFTGCIVNHQSRAAIGLCNIDTCTAFHDSTIFSVDENTRAVRTLQVNDQSSGVRHIQVIIGFTSISFLERQCNSTAVYINSAAVGLGQGGGSTYTNAISHINFSRIG
ncbi:hypothetical protein HmCmsJML254_00339 [Escherichia coli]|nr:hypothetical protein HmCmsJML254_00339 [Escherichia coli]